MSDLKRRLSETLAHAFAVAGLPPELGRAGPSDRPDLADFQCNGALAAAKAAKANPRVLAEQVVATLKADARFSSVEIAGPGFINLVLSNAFLTERARQIAADPRFGAEVLASSRKVVVDYGGPNVAKPMHVGHLRASIIGESIKRLFRFRGDQVWGDAHFGDWGFQMGLLIVAVGDEQPDLAFLAPGQGPFPDESPVTLADLERLYPLAAAKAKADLDKAQADETAYEKAEGLVMADPNTEVEVARLRALSAQGAAASTPWSPPGDSSSRPATGQVQLTPAIIAMRTSSDRLAACILVIRLAR